MKTNQVSCNGLSHAPVRACLGLGICLNRNSCYTEKPWPWNHHYPCIITLTAKGCLTIHTKHVICLYYKFYNSLYKRERRNSEITSSLQIFIFSLFSCQLHGQRSPKIAIR